jgi:hypothetical protein
MAANPIVTQKAIEILGIDWGFGQWLLAAWAPALVAALVLPWSMRLVSRATVDVAAVRAVISDDLRAYCGPSCPLHRRTRPALTLPPVCM